MPKPNCLDSLKKSLELLECRLAPSASLVRDINPGPTSSQARNLTGREGIIYFNANDGIHGNELWRSDGTSSGTTLVRNINPGLFSNFPAQLTFAGDTLFFSAFDAATGIELWRSNGTSSGTTLIRNIQPSSYYDGIGPRYLANVAGTLFFSANDGITGSELWRSDGTSSGTTLVKDIRPGIGNAFITPLDGLPISLSVNVGGTLFFAANDGTIGRELWKSDGTSTGTVLVKDIRPGSSNSSPYDLINVNGTLHFDADDGVTGFELWRSDGTSSGTTLVKDIRPGNSGSAIRYLINNNGVLFFSAESGSSGTNGKELWRSDGTLNGTVLDADLEAASESAPTNLAVMGGRMFYRGQTLATGRELFATLPPPTTVGGTTINAGDPQRSRVTNIAVTFSASTDVALFQNPGAVTLTRTSGGPAASVTIGSGLIVTPGAGNSNTITLTFGLTSNTAIEHGSLADGRWQLAIPSLNYTSPLHGLDLRRLYGEINNDLTVDGADLTVFGNNFGTSFVALDWNNDGTIDGTDLTQFGNRFGLTI
jgi:ELWxxDGT repeat protein